MSGAFWRFNNGFSSFSKISNILENHQPKEKEEIYSTLCKLFEENDLLQELSSNNAKLLQFLRDKNVISVLVDFVIHEGRIQTGLNEGMHNLSLSSKKMEGEKGAENKDESESEEALSSPDERKDEVKEKDHSNSEKGHEEKYDDINENENTEDIETEDEKFSRYAAIATEILSADVWSLTDAVMESTDNLNKLWSVLDKSPPLSITLSSYVMKIMEHLLDMKCDEMITYLIDQQTNLVEKMVKHFSNPPLEDFLVKLLSTDKPDNSTGIIEFLQQQNFISYLIDALDNLVDEQGSIEKSNALMRQTAAADFLKALITISANSNTDNSTIGPNELTRELVSYSQMEKLCNIMLKGGYSLANGVGVIIEIIRKNNSDYDLLPVLYITLESHPPSGRDSIYLGHLLKVYGSRIEDFNNFLVNKDRTSSKSRLKTLFGELEPLGFERFKICELIAELLHCSNMALLNDKRGFDIVSKRDEVRSKMREMDPISFKYNETIPLPDDVKEDLEEDKKRNQTLDSDQNNEYSNPNDTIDSFNRSDQESDSIVQHRETEYEAFHANAYLSEEQIRNNSVVGDYLKIALYDTQIINQILVMFFQYPWNNFLHNVVFDIVQQVLNGSMDIGFNKYLAIDLFNRGDITNKIIEGQKSCNEFETKNNGLRLGFMGHLTLIAEEVVKFIQLYPVNSLSPLIDVKVEGYAWEEYVNNILYDTRDKYNAILGGGDDDDEDPVNAFDENSGEIIDHGDYKPDLVFDPSEDPDVLSGTYDENGDVQSESKSPDNDSANEPKDSDSSDESSEDDDDHFSSYMSQQLTNTASSDHGSFATSKKKTESETNTQSENRPNDNIDEFYEGEKNDYIDPNDDGLSYKKDNPIYDFKGNLLYLSNRQEEDISSEDSASSSSSSSDDDIEIDDEEPEKTTEKESEVNHLTRETSKS